MGSLAFLGSPISDEEIRMLFRSARRYQFGADQDMNPIVAFLHNSYAVAYVDAIEQLTEDGKRIDAAVRGDLGSYRDFKEFKKAVYRLQDKLQAKAEKLHDKLKGTAALKEFTSFL
jgi:hypothetical protein